MEELRPLWTFMQVARMGSLTAAAHALSLSSAAVSKSVGKLERQVGTALFSRAGRSLRLTSEGQRLYEQIDASFGNIEAALIDVRQRHGVPSGTVRVSSVTLFGRMHVIPLLPEFFALYPEINLVMSLHDGARGLSRHGYDVRINWGEEPEQGKVAHPLMKMHLAMVASPAYLARRGTPRTLEELADHDCISTHVNGLPPTVWRFTRRAIGRRKAGATETFVPRGRFVVEDELEAVGTAAVEGLGVTLIATESVQADIDSGALVELMGGYLKEGANSLQTEVILQHSTRKLMSPATAALVDFLLDRLRGLDASSNR